MIPPTGCWILRFYTTVCCFSEFDLKNLADVVAVDASAVVEVDQFCLVGAVGFEEVAKVGLALLFGIDDSERGVDLLAEALDGVYFALIADRALNVIVIGSVEIFLDHIRRESDLANARGTDLAVRGFWEIE